VYFRGGLSSTSQPSIPRSSCQTPYGVLVWIAVNREGVHGSLGLCVGGKMTNKVRSFAFSAAMVASVAAAFTGDAKADVGGQVQVSLLVSAGCFVNGEVQGNTNQFGELNFGSTAPLWSNVLSGEVIGPNGVLQIHCEGTGGFLLSIDGGLRGTREMEAAGDRIAYEVFQDASRTKVYPIDGLVDFPALDNEPVRVPIYGVVRPNMSKPKPEALYTDTLNLTLYF
jgi:spore coat protein U-like protein